MTGEFLRIAALEHLHLVLDEHTVCGRRVERSDTYTDEVGLRVWNHGEPDRCTVCENALSARLRFGAKVMA